MCTALPTQKERDRMVADGGLYLLRMLALHSPDIATLTECADAFARLAASGIKNLPSVFD